MAVRIELTGEGRAALRELREASTPEVFGREVLQFFDRKAALIAGQISSSIRSGGLVNRRTGNLARSIVGFGALVDGNPGFEVGVTQGPALSYAGVLEFGTKGINPESPIPTITPKNANNLAIPVGPALTPAGVPRYQGPRDYPDALSFRPTKSAKSTGVLIDEGRDEIAYVLVKSVDVAPRAYLSTGVEKALPGLVGDLEAFLVQLAEGDPQ